MITAKEQQLVTAMKANLESFQQTGKWLFIYNLLEQADALYEAHYGPDDEEAELPPTTNHGGTY